MRVVIVIMTLIIILSPFSQCRADLGYCVTQRLAVAFKHFNADRELFKGDTITFPMYGTWYGYIVTRGDIESDSPYDNIAVRHWIGNINIFKLDLGGPVCIIEEDPANPWKYWR